MKFSLATLIVVAATSASLDSSVSAFAPNSNFRTSRLSPLSPSSPLVNGNFNLKSSIPSDCETEPLGGSNPSTHDDDDEDELPAGATPIIAARNDLILTAKELTAQSPTGLFLTLPNDRQKFMKAIARLEAIAPTTSDESEPLSIGDWELVATSRKTTLDLVGAGAPKKNGKLPKLNPKIKDSIKVTQRIRCTTSELKIIDRIDNVITFDNSVTHLLPSFLNPFKIDQSKLILVHNAKVETFVPFRTKLALKSVVLNLAGQTQNLDPDGADIFGLNIPSLSEWMNAGEFDTTYVDGDVRVSRGTIGILEETRVFVKKGYEMDAFDVDVDMDVDVDADVEVDEEEKGLKKIATAVSSVGRAVEDLTKDVQKTLSKEIESSVQEIKEVVEDDLKGVEEAVGKVKSAVIGDDEVEVAVDNAVSAVQELRKDVKDSIEVLREKVDEDVGKIQDAVKGVRGAVVKDEKNGDSEDDDCEEVEEASKEVVDDVEAVEEDAAVESEDVVEDVGGAASDTVTDADTDGSSNGKKKKNKKNKKKN